MTTADEELTGKAALVALDERQALHDGRLCRFDFDGDTGFGPNLTLEVFPRAESQVAEVKISISSVTRLDVAWDVSDGHFYLVTGYKALLLESGRVYISLDPYDDRDNRVDDRDSFVLEGEAISVKLRMKPSVPLT